MRHATRRFCSCCVAALALSACSGDDTALPTEPPVEPRDTTTTAVATTVPPTTDPPPTTMVATTTSPPPTAAPTSATPTTTSPPTTATDPDIEAALAAVDGYYVAWRECLRDLPACDTSVFATVADPVTAADFAAQIAERQADYEEAENVESYTYIAESTRRVEGRIIVTVCQRDGILMFRRPPGEPETLLSDEFASKVREWHVDPTEAGWRIVGATTIQEASGLENDLCS